MQCDTFFAKEVAKGKKSQENGEECTFVRMVLFNNIFSVSIFRVSLILKSFNRLEKTIIFSCPFLFASVYVLLASKNS